jgi:membrane protease YdiL (CAAX protease family)
MPPTSSTTSSERSAWSRSNIALAGWLAIAAGLVALAFYGTSQAESAVAERDLLFEYEFTVQSLVGYGLIIGFTFAVAAAFPDIRLALGFRSFPRRWVWVTLGLTLASLVVSAALEPLLHAGEEQGLAPTEWHADRAGAFAANAVVVALVAPFAEELFFRGLGVRVLGFLGATVAVTGTALAFALVHGLLSALPALGFFGLVLAYARYRTKSIWPGFIAHGLYNGVGIAFAVYFALDESPGFLLGFLR